MVSGVVVYFQYLNAYQRAATKKPDNGDENRAMQWQVASSEQSARDDRFKFRTTDGFANFQLQEIRSMASRFLRDTKPLFVLLSAHIALSAGCGKRHEPMRITEVPTATEERLPDPQPVAPQSLIPVRINSDNSVVSFDPNLKVDLEIGDTLVEVDGQSPKTCPAQLLALPLRRDELEAANILLKGDDNDLQFHRADLTEKGITEFAEHNAREEAFRCHWREWFSGYVATDSPPGTEVTLKVTTKNPRRESEVSFSMRTVELSAIQFQSHEIQVDDASTDVFDQRKFSNDGTLMCLGSSVIDLETGKAVATFEPPRRNWDLEAMQISADNRYVLAEVWPKIAEPDAAQKADSWRKKPVEERISAFYDLQQGGKPVFGHEAEGRFLWFDSQIFVFAHLPVKSFSDSEQEKEKKRLARRIELKSWRDDNTLLSLPFKDGETPHAAAISSDQRLLAVAWNSSNKSFISITDIESGKESYLSGEFAWQEDASCLAFNPAGTQIATGDERTVRLWSVPQKTLLTYYNMEGGKAGTGSPRSQTVLRATGGGNFVLEDRYSAGRTLYSMISSLTYLSDSEIRVEFAGGKERTVYLNANTGNYSWFGNLYPYKSLFDAEQGFADSVWNKDLTNMYWSKPTYNNKGEVVGGLDNRTTEFSFVGSDGCPRLISRFVEKSRIRGEELSRYRIGVVSGISVMKKTIEFDDSSR